MRAVLVVGLLFAASLVAVAASKSRNDHFEKSRIKSGPRGIRGFKPSTLSTAYSFGKREDSIESSRLNRHDKILFTLLQNFPQGISVDWLLREMKTNPVLVGRLTRMLIGKQNGRIPNPEEAMLI